MAATQPFKMVYRICGVDKGGLQVVRDPGEKYPEPDIDISGPSGVVRIGDWSKFCHAVIENLLSSMEMKMNVIDHAFLTNLKGANRLFLPGAGVFNFTRPLFNKRGDMVTNVAYMGWVFLSLLEAEPPGCVDANLLVTASRSRSQVRVPTPQLVSYTESSKRSRRPSSLRSQRSSGSYAGARGIPRRLRRMSTRIPPMGSSV